MAAFENTTVSKPRCNFRQPFPRLMSQFHRECSRRDTGTVLRILTSGEARDVTLLHFGLTPADHWNPSNSIESRCSRLISPHKVSARFTRMGVHHQESLYLSHRPLRARRRALKYGWYVGHSSSLTGSCQLTLSQSQTAVRDQVFGARWRRKCLAPAPDSTITIYALTFPTRLSSHSTTSTSCRHVLLRPWYSGAPPHLSGAFRTPTASFWPFLQ
jgi:hypothetical protein